MLQNKEIKKYMDAGQIIISHINENSIGSVSIDLRVKAIGYTKLNKDLNLGDPITLEQEVKIEEENMVIEPKDTVLFCTKEIVSISNNITGILTCRSTSAKVPLLVHLPALVDPGYSGVLTGNITNLSNKRVTIPKDFRICQIMFYETKNAKDYSKMKRSKNHLNNYLNSLHIKFDKEYRK